MIKKAVHKQSKPSWVTGAIHNSDQFDNLILGLKESLFWAYIFHDKDKNEDGSAKPKHIHFIAQNAPRSFDWWSDALGIPSNFIERVHRPRAMVRYLIHLDDPDKAQYSLDEIETNDRRYLETYFNQDTDKMNTNLFYDIKRLRFGRITPDEFIDRYDLELRKMAFYNRFRLFNEIAKFDEAEPPDL